MHETRPDPMLCYENAGAQGPLGSSLSVGPLGGFNGLTGEPYINAYFLSQPPGSTFDAGSAYRYSLNAGGLPVYVDVPDTGEVYRVVPGRFGRPDVELVEFPNE